MNYCIFRLLYAVNLKKLIIHRTNEKKHKTYFNNVQRKQCSWIIALTFTFFPIDFVSKQRKSKGTHIFTHNSLEKKKTHAVKKRPSRFKTTYWRSISHIKQWKSDWKKLFFMKKGSKKKMHQITHSAIYGHEELANIIRKCWFYRYCEIR